MDQTAAPTTSFSATTSSRRSLRGRMHRGAAVLTALAFGATGTGCLSHEYQVSRSELQRLTQLPPDARGQQLTVVQKMGVRRAAALNPHAPGPPAPAYPHEGPYEDDRGGHVHTHVIIDGGTWGSGHGRGAPARRGGGYGAPGTGGGGVVVAPPVGAQASRPAMAQPLGGGASATGPVPARAVTPASSGRGSSLPRGSGGKDDLVALAAVAVAVAAFAVVGLAFTEGARFDGQAAVSPGQQVYLQGQDGGERAVPLHLLTEADLTGVDHGLLRDDEGYGMYRLGRAPLNRRGFTFKLDVGGMVSDHHLLAGFASHIAAGYFPHHRLGLLAGVSLAGLDDGAGNTVPRHAATGEVQFFPLSWRRLHLGVAGNVGTMLASDAATNGQLTYGGGVLMEIAITTRLAFTARGDITAYDKVGPDGTGRSLARSLALGLAVY